MAGTPQRPSNAPRSRNPLIDIGGRLYPADRTLTDEDIDTIERVGEAQQQRDETHQREVNALYQLSVRIGQLEAELANLRARGDANTSALEGELRNLQVQERSDRARIEPRLMREAELRERRMQGALAGAAEWRRQGRASDAASTASGSWFHGKAQWLLFALAVFADAADYFIPGAQLPLLGDVADIVPLLAILLFGKRRWVALISALELIPAVITDLLPMHTLAVGMMLFLSKQQRAASPSQPTIINKLMPERRRSYLPILILILFVVSLLWFVIPGVHREGAKKVFGNFFTCTTGSKNADSPIAQWCRAVVRMGNAVFGALKGTVNWIDRFTEQQIAIATGDYYTGNVDAQAKQKLGVFLENVEPSSREFEDTEAVTIWGTLTALTLDEDKPINVRLSCTRDAARGLYGNVDPEFLPGLTNLDRQDLTCAFGRGEIPEGTETITLAAHFNFETQAYLKAYFMDRQRLQALRRDGQDPLDFYDVPDTHPTAVYTNGPVMIGMEMLEPLVGLSDQQETKFRIGITLENLWEGEIEAIRNLTIKIPEFMALTDCEANKNFQKVTCEGEECEDGKYQHVYRLAPTALQRLKGIATYESFACRIKFDPRARNAVLGNVPLATHYIKVAAAYDYELHAQTVVTVKPSSGFNVYLSPAEAPLRQPDGRDTTVICTGKHSDTQITKADYEFLRLTEGGVSEPLGEPRPMTCGEHCQVTIIPRAEGFHAGDTLICRIHNPAFETLRSQSKVRVTCSESCANSADGEVYNACMEDCTQRFERQEFTAEDTLSIVNSKPYVKFQTPSATVRPGGVMHLDITITDPDVADHLAIGYRFSGVSIQPYLNDNIPCQILANEQRCEFPLDEAVTNVEIGDTLTIDLTPTDGHTTGKTKVATFTVVAP